MKKQFDLSIVEAMMEEGVILECTEIGGALFGSGMSPLLRLGDYTESRGEVLFLLREAGVIVHSDD